MFVHRVLCRIGLHHWTVVRTRDVPPYTACARCQKEQMLDLRPDGMMGGTEGRLFGQGRF